MSQYNNKGSASPSALFSCHPAMTGLCCHMSVAMDAPGYPFLPMEILGLLNSTKPVMGCACSSNRHAHVTFNLASSAIIAVKMQQHDSRHGLYKPVQDLGYILLLRACAGSPAGASFFSHPR